MPSENKIWTFVLSKPGRWCLFILFALFSTNLWLPRNWSFYGGNDWDLTYSMYESARKSVVQFGQWPWYNPFMSYGYDMVADPQAGQFSIFFIPILIFGTFYGYKLSILMAIVIGCFGAYKLFHAIHPDKKIATLTAIIFCATPYFSGHILQAGHSNVLYLYLLPWFLFFMIRLRQNKKLSDLIFAAIILTQILVGGAPIVFLIATSIGLIWLVSDLWIHKKYDLFIPFFAVLFSTILLSLWKILPGLQLWSETPRLVKDESGISLMEWLQTLAGYRTRTGTWHAWWEYVLGFNLVLLGIIFYFRSKITGLWKWLVLTGIVIWFCMGNAPEYFNPWYWMNKYVPVFTSLRAPSRFGFIVLMGLFVAFVSATKFATTEKKFLYTILIFVTIAQTLSFRADASFIEDSPMMEISEVTGKASDSVRIATHFHAEKNNQFLHILNNEIVPDAYQPLVLTTVTDSVKTLFVGAGNTRFTPNRIALDAKKDTVIVNQRYSENWSILGKGIMYSHHGLIGLKNASGSIQLCYSNKRVYTGLWLGLLVIPLWLGLFFLWKRPKPNSMN